MQPPLRAIHCPTAGWPALGRHGRRRLRQVRGRRAPGRGAKLPLVEGDSFHPPANIAAPGLRFLHLALTPQQSLARVASRAGHFYPPPSLVDSQFAELEHPAGEPGVVTANATAPIDQVVAQALSALRPGPAGFNIP